MLSDIICAKLPPQIPTHTEYSLTKDDGTVTASNLTYPSFERTNNFNMNSTIENIDIPRNFMANLT